MDDLNFKGKMYVWGVYLLFLLSMGVFMRGVHGNEFKDGEVCDCVKCVDVDSDLASGRIIDLNAELEAEDLERDYIKEEINRKE